MKKISVLSAEAAQQSRKSHDPLALTRKNLSGERVFTAMTIPYSRKREDEVLPNTERILASAKKTLS